MPHTGKCVVPETGLEPVHLAVADFKSATSTNFVTRAKRRVRTRFVEDGAPQIRRILHIARTCCFFDGSVFMTRLRPLFILLACAVAQGAGAQPLDYAGARTLAHERIDNLRMLQAEADRRAHEAQSDRSLHGPKITLDTKQVWGRKSVDLGSIDVGSKLGSGMAGAGAPPIATALGQMLANMPPIDLKFDQDLDGPRAALNVELPIWTGGAISAKVAAADAATDEARLQVTAARDQADTELATKYFAVQLARSVQNLQSERLAQQELEVKKAQRFEATGTISKLERMAVEVNRDAAKRELLAAQTNTRVAEAELAGLLRVPSLDALTSPLFIVTSNLGSLAEWQDRALSNSPILAGIRAQSRQADEGVTAAKAAWAPQVYAFANKNLITHYLSITEPDWVAGVGVRFTLWDNKDRTAKVAAARSLVDKAQAAQAEVVNRLKTAVETAYLRSDQAREAYRLTDSTLAMAQENLRLRERGFAEGISTADDVNDARNKLLAARIARRVAAYRFVVAWATLHSVAGTPEGFVASMEQPNTIFEN